MIPGCVRAGIWKEPVMAYFKHGRGGSEDDHQETFSQITRRWSRDSNGAPREYKYK